MRRYAYGVERTAEVHAEAEGRALGPLEERSMYSRHCASAREKEQERRVPGPGVERRNFPSGTPAGARGAGGGGGGGGFGRGLRGADNKEGLGGAAGGAPPREY